jgi:hypothetical protein
MCGCSQGDLRSAVDVETECWVRGQSSAQSVARDTSSTWMKWKRCSPPSDIRNGSPWTAAMSMSRWAAGPRRTHKTVSDENETIRTDGRRDVRPRIGAACRRRSHGQSPRKLDGEIRMGHRRGANDARDLVLSDRLEQTRDVEQLALNRSDARLVHLREIAVAAHDLLAPLGERAHDVAPAVAETSGDKRRHLRAVFMTSNNWQRLPPMTTTTGRRRRRSSGLRLAAGRRRWGSTT